MHEGRGYLIVQLRTFGNRLSNPTRTVSKFTRLFSKSVT